MPIVHLLAQTCSFLARLLGMSWIIPKIRGADFFFEIG